MHAGFVNHNGKGFYRPDGERGKSGNISTRNEVTGVSKDKEIGT